MYLGFAELMLGFADLLHHIPGVEVIKLFSCSTQLSIKSKLLLNDKIDQINFRIRSQNTVIYPAYKC